jgi:L-lactate dehydrogenase complex protein LldF
VTGQAISAYTSHFHGPSAPGQVQHVVIVDNGRSRLRNHPAFREALGCIRCGACLNTCPVYRRSGGHSYATAVPGPIGSVLAPGRDAAAHASLPRACSLCGSCDEVCPVRIPLHTQLLAWRAELSERGLGGRRRLALRALGRAMTVGWLYRIGGRALRRIGRLLPAGITRRLAAPWTRGRELPPLPAHDFRTLYARRRRAR